MRHWLVSHSLNSHSVIIQEPLVLLLCVLQSTVPFVDVVGEIIDFTLQDSL
jgi:hypothetical protein